MEVRIKVPKDFNDSEPIALANFSNGSVQDPSSSGGLLKMRMMKKPGERSDRKRVLVCETDNMTYSGTNYETEDGLYTPPNTRYFIGSLNKRSKIMTLHKADVFNLTPKIKGMQSISSATPLKTQYTREDYITTNDKMVLSFGSERAKRALASAKRNKIDSSTLDSTLLTAFDYADDETKKPDNEETTSSSQSPSFLPPYNSEATEPENVYQLSDIISDSILAQLRVPAAVLVEATSEDILKWKAEEKYSQFVLTNLTTLPKGKADAVYKRASILVYCDYLIKMYLMNSREVKERGLSKLYHIAESIRLYLLSQYTEQGPRSSGTTGVLTNKMKDKIIASLVILALMISGYSFEILVLQRDLLVQSTKIVDVSKALGCTVISSTNRRVKGQTKQYTISLQIPLVFGKPSKGRKGK